jgi:hypothetical protein
MSRLVERHGVGGTDAQPRGLAGYHGGDAIKEETPEG